MIWHSVSAQDVLNKFEVDDTKGLHKGVADIRIQNYGKNVIAKKGKKSLSRYILEQFKSKMIITLFLIAIISFGVSLFYEDIDFYTPLLIIAIIVINSVVSAYQIFRCENTLESIKKYSNSVARVLRDGIIQNISSEDLVPGDILLLEEGDYISADARIIDCNEFRCNEMNISGEAIPVEKNGDLILDDITEITARSNMVYSGASVAHGNAKVVVVATGLHTEAGHAAAILRETGEAAKLPMQNKLDNISTVVNTIVFIGCALVFLIGMAQNFDYKPFANMTMKMLTNSFALAVAAIPEGLPAIATTVFAIGVQRIMYDNIIIKDVEALETLGEATIICCDKTGILTRNKMELSCIFDGNKMIDVEKDKIDENSSLILRLANACSTLENDSTEYAIEKACLNYTSFSKLDVEAHYPRFTEIPFDSIRKTMTTINMIDSKPFAIVKGAPEIVIPKCKNCDIEMLLKVNEAMANKALRIVCIAIKPLGEVPANPHPDDIENELNFIGLLGLADPPRRDTAENIILCKNAGIKTVMITGDNLATANAVANQVGILGENGLSITGEELAELSDEELSESIEKYSVFARISPEDKVRIVKAWQSKGEIVTITGDDISDADALKIADVGCSMSKFGKDVAKGNADVIIMNNRFDSLVCAIKESRGLINNIKKALHYLLSCNFAEIVIVVLGMIIFGDLPLVAVQILWINLLTDCAPAFSISMESADDYVMKKSNKSAFGKLFDLKSTINLFAMTFVMIVVTLLAYAIGNVAGQNAGTTMAFLTLGLVQILNSFNYKSNESIINKKIFSNKFMNFSSLLLVFVIVFLSFTPAGFVFSLEILSLAQFLIALALSLLIIPLGELSKYLINKYL